MPVYQVLPTKEQWKKDLGLHTVLGNFKSPFPAMERIGKLLAAAQAPAPVANPGLDTVAMHAGMLARMHYFYHLDNATHFVLKNLNNKAKLGGSLDSKQTAAVQALYNLVHGRLTAQFVATNGNFDLAMAEVFGRQVGASSQSDDAMLVSRGFLQYFDAAARQVLKLSFRGGLAHRWSYKPVPGNPKGTLNLYDTEACEDRHLVNTEGGAGLFVMDGKGAIYAYGQEPDGVQLKHSSFLSGAPAACAGTMRIEKGLVAWVTGQSGHYRPTVAQMANLLERLRAYAVDLSKVTVYRENNTIGRQANVPRINFEGCQALDLLRLRHWPNGQNPDAMRVG